MNGEEATERNAWSGLGRFLRRVPRQERARAVVTAILEAADEAIETAEAGPLQTLFTRAGVAAGSFYEYFASRDALLAAVVERVTQHNFEAFEAEVVDVLAANVSLEAATRDTADRITTRYLARPAHLRSIIRLADQLGLLSHVASERDRFATAMGARLADRLALTGASRDAALCAMADAVTGVIVVSLYRSPMPPVAAIATAASDVAWSVLRTHVERAAPTLQP